jgi:prepilin-type N-terminal cleavage/methylation domain-containing protein
MMIVRPGNMKRGFTLVELIATIAASGVLLVLATGVMHRMMRFESKSRQRASVHLAAVRLSHDFRYDVHQANGFKIGDSDDQQPTIRLTLPEGSDVTYQVAGQRVLREQRLDNQQVARETYEFPADHQMRFSDSDARMAELTIVHNLPIVGVEPQTVIHVAAEVGRLLRLTAGEEVAP